MKKTLEKKLKLHRETLAVLNDARLALVEGAVGTGNTKFCTLTDNSCDRTCTC